MTYLDMAMRWKIEDLLEDAERAGDRLFRGETYSVFSVATADGAHFLVDSTPPGYVYGYRTPSTLGRLWWKRRQRTINAAAFEAVELCKLADQRARERKMNQGAARLAVESSGEIAKIAESL